MRTLPGRFATLRLRSTAIQLAAVLGVQLPTLALAQGQPQPPSPSRGELLYRTHCAACHSSQMHWREKKTVRDWPSLRAQVTFWQAQAVLGWGDDDITEVARYLNATFYRLPPPADAKTAGAPPGPPAATARAQRNAVAGVPGPGAGHLPAPLSGRPTRMLLMVSDANPMATSCHQFPTPASLIDCEASVASGTSSAASSWKDSSQARDQRS